MKRQKWGVSRPTPHIYMGIIYDFHPLEAHCGYHFLGVGHLLEDDVRHCADAHLELRGLALVVDHRSDDEPCCGACDPYCSNCALEVQGGDGHNSCVVEVEVCQSRGSR